MKRSLLSCAVAAALGTHSVFVSALDELVLQAVKNGDPASGYTFKLDGKTEKISDSSGMVMFDLSSGGAHSIQILKDGETVHSFRFDSAGGQLTDINISIPDSGKPKVAVESYFKTETASQKSDAATGTITGRVSSVVTPISNATISVVGTDITTETNAFGVYELTLPRGVYDLVINHPDFGTNEVKDYRVVSNVTKRSNFSIDPAREIEEVTVVAKVSASAFQENERYSANVIDTMDMEQLARFGDTDIAASVVRVPSVRVQDDQYIFIRGLGGRYVSTTLNGSAMPSTNPSKRTVPLDLFPSNIVEQLDVKKTFVASMPGESTGGNLVINTRTFPQEQAGKLSFSLGYVDGLTGDDAYVDPSSGKFDWAGWDDGTRQEPGILRSISDALDNSDFYSDDVQQQLRQAGAWEIQDDWDYDTKSVKPDISLGANYGDVFLLEALDADLGFFVAANYKNEWGQKKDGVIRTYSPGDLSVLDDFEAEEYTNEINSSGLISVGLDFGSNTYTSNTLVSRVTEETVFRGEGFDGDALEQSLRWNIEWEERQYLSQQFTGTHLLGEDEEWTVEWQVTASQARRDAPDRREVRFDLSGNDGIYNLEVPDLLRRYDELTDDNYDGSVDVEYMLGSSGDLESVINFGLQAITRERESDSYTYGFTGGQTAIDDNAPNQLVSDVLTDANITGDTATGYVFVDKTLLSDSYDAEMDLNSLYLSYDMTWYSQYQFIIGARYEDYEQSTDTFNIQTGDPVLSKIDEDAVLPSLSFNWFYTDDMQLRFAITETVSRPDFKETSNATFYDKEFNIRVVGNPNLEVSEVMNYDVRWERYYSDTETLSVALFYKDMDSPIERVVLPASGTAGNSRTFQNAESAELWGLEVDGRKDFPFNESLTQSLFVALNASYIDSEVEVLGGETRELQGAPDYTLNLILGYDDIENGHEVTLLFNQNGESIKDVGVAGLPDVIEEPRLSVDVNYKYYLTDDLIFKAKIKNLVNDEVEFTQGGKVFQRYEKGMEFKAGFDWNF